MKILSETTKTHGQQVIHYSVWLEWALTNGAALAIGYALAEALIQQSDNANGALIGAVVGIAVGVMQWLVLWRRITKSIWWMLTCFFGWSVGLAVTWAIQDILFGGLAGLRAWETAGPIIMGVAVGLLLGNLQWFILRQQVHQAAWWILISVVAWPISIGYGTWAIKRLDLEFDIEYSTFLIFEQAIEGIIAGVVLGLITGGVLLWLLQYKSIPFENRLQTIKPFEKYEKSVGCVSVAIILTMMVCFIPSLLCGDLSFD